MKIVFKIEPSVDENVALHLLAEVGDEDISFLIFSRSPFKIEGFVSLGFDKNTVSKIYIDNVKKYIEELSFLKGTNFSTTTIFYNYTTSTLVPILYFLETEKQQILNQLFVPDKSRLCLQETCKWQSIKNIYSVPAVVHNYFLELYPQSKFAHSTSYQLSNSHTTYLYCILYNSSIKIILFKEGQLQIVQYFDYSSPEDVCYYLLNVAERFDITPSSLPITLSGMVDVDSIIYYELYKYFLNISFATTEVKTAERLNELPTHFYHHLTSLAHAHH